MHLFNADAPEYFGDFSRGFYTLFTVLLGRWPDDSESLKVSMGMIIILTLFMFGIRVMVVTGIIVLTALFILACRGSPQGDVLSISVTAAVIVEAATVTRQQWCW